jgi:hypothetical protein
LLNRLLPASILQQKTVTEMKDETMSQFIGLLFQVGSATRAGFSQRIVLLKPGLFVAC